MDDRVFLLCGLLLMMVIQQSLEMPSFEDARCEPSGQVSYQIKGAVKYYLKSSLCATEIQIPNSASNWYTINGTGCDYTMDEAFTAQLTKSSFGIFNAADDDLSESFVCSASSANGLQSQKLSINFNVAQTTGSPVIIPVTPEVKVEIFRGDCVTPVTGAVSPGDPLCMVIGIENGFQGMSMQIQQIKIQSPGTGWYILTGGDGMPGCATYDYFNAGLWSQLEQFPNPATQRVLFSAFLITESTAPQQQTFEITMLICKHPSFAQCNANYQGCLPSLPSGSRRKRDLGVDIGPEVRWKRDVGDTAEIQLSASMWVDPGSGTGKVLSNTGSNSGTNTVNNAGNQEGLTGNDVNAEQQTGSEECEVCLKRSVLYGLIGFFIPALLLAFCASACLWWKTRKQSKRIEETETEIITRGPESMRGASSFRNPGYTP